MTLPGVHVIAAGAASGDWVKVHLAHRHTEKTLERSWRASGTEAALVQRYKA